SAARRAKYAAAAPAFDGPVPTAAPQELQSVSDPRVDKLLKTTWGQDDTYYVPVSGAPVGCVQTAEGQVMYYHRWPTAGIGKLTGYPSGQGVSGAYTTRGGDGEGGPYDWNAMGKSDNAGYMARSALMYDLGVINGVNWKVGGSGANLNVTRLKSDLKYASAFECYGTTGHYTTNQTDTTRANMTNALCCNLDAGYPCPNAGGTVGGSGSGHQTVVDGYGFQDGLLYFHVNMGWGGSWDAYFLAPRFDSYALHEIVYNVFPKTTGEIVSGRVTDAGGRGMQGVTVTVTDSSGGVKTTTTNARGIWSVIVPSATTHTVVASRNGYTSQTRTVAVGTSSGYSVGNRWGVDFTLLPVGKAVVTGTVRNRDGILFGGLSVVTGDGSASAVTGDDGFYTLPVPGGGWSGTVKLADNQGLLGSEPASYSFSSVAAGAIFPDRDFVVDSVLFVDCDATGNGSGTSWENAYTDLQAALLAAGTGTEIWVAEGTYKPTAGTDRSATFSLPDGVVIYGGFSGVETARDQRNWVQHMTRISGDIGVAGTATDNVKQLITAAGAGRVDGFVISDAYRENGGGSLIDGVNIQRKNYGSGVLDLVFDHCLFRDNACYYYLVEGGMSFRNCIFYNNRTLYLSSGKPYYEFSRDCEFQFCTFAGNTFDLPGWSSSSSFENCYLQDNDWTSSSYSSSAVKYCIVETDLPVPNGTSVLSADESWTAGPYTAPVLPPANSAGKNHGVAPSWASASTFDYLGNPRVVGSAVDCGAIEIQASPAAALAAAALDVGYTVATLQACVFSLGSGSSATLTVEYGTSPSLSGATALTASVSGPATKSFSLTGLAFGTTYYYRAKLSGGSTASTEILTFRTKAMTAPTVALGAVGDPSTSAISVGWSLSALGAGAAKATVYVDYSTSETFATHQSATAKTDATGAASGTVSITGLAAGTTYYVRVRAVNDGGLAGTSGSASFTTLDAAAPDFTVSAAAGSVCTRGVATLDVSTFGTGASSGVANVDVSIWPDFREFRRFTADLASPGAVQVELSRLGHSTLYYVRASVRNDLDRTTTKSPVSFRTGPSPYASPGLLQAVLSGAYDKTTDIASHETATIVPGVIMAYTASKGSSTWNGTTYSWADNRTFGYTGEMFVEAGTTYTFGKYLDDSGLVVVDGTKIIDNGSYSQFVTGQYTAASTGWVPIEVRIGNGSGGSGAMANQFGIGFNTVGNKTQADFKEPTWSKLLDPGDGSLLRVPSSGSLPSFVSLDDDLQIVGTTLAGTVRTAGIEESYTVTLHAGHVNAGSNVVDWAQSLDLGTVPSENYDIAFRWEDFCSADDLDGWFVVARMTNPSGSYEGWSVVREPSTGSGFYTDWFDVKWSSQGWGSGTAWRTSAGEAAAGGSWTVP
ncbi:MAG: C10 family peptidase, partial [Kiritimatiellae bacterium]|nr:C10 family peptidase [Kiritimatiellia bacterium]